MMVGRKVDLYDVKKKSEVKKNAKNALEVRDLGVEGVIENVSFVLKEGEILGFAGLVGSGRSEVAKAIFGFYPKTTGKILINNKEVN